MYIFNLNLKESKSLCKFKNHTSIFILYLLNKTTLETLFLNPFSFGIIDVLNDLCLFFFPPKKHYMNPILINILFYTYFHITLLEYLLVFYRMIHVLWSGFLLGIVWMRGMYCSCKWMWECISLFASIDEWGKRGAQRRRWKFLGVLHNWIEMTIKKRKSHEHS